MVAMPGAAKTAKSSGMITKTGSHVLEISGYSLHRDYDEPGLCIVPSAVFDIGGYNWENRFFPRGINEDSKDYVAVFVYSKSNISDTRVRASFQLSLLDVTGSSPPYTMTTQTQEFGHGCHHKCGGLAKFMKRSELEESPYLRDDRLTIDCVAVITLVHDAKSLAELLPPSDIAEHLGRLLHEKERTDVVFLVEGEAFPAHKMVLAMRSPVFKAEHYGGMRETETDRIAIGDMQPAIFEALLHFVYTDSLPATMDDLDRDDTFKDTIRHLLVAADRYAMERLKIMCGNILCSNIDVETVVTTLVLAEQHSCAMLSDACVQFVASLSRKQMHNVMASQGYAELKATSPLALIELWEKTCKIGMISKSSFHVGA
jgi:speckle-type POZ protein